MDKRFPSAALSVGDEVFHQATSPGVTVAQIRAAAGRVHYGWIVVGISFFVIVATAGVRNAPGVLIVPLEAEFGWSRATISLAIGVNLLLYGAVGPFAAAAMDRFGARRTMLAALIATATAVALSAAMYQPWQMVLLWGGVIGLATGMVGAYLAAYIAGRWFRAREGLVVGTLTAANAAGQLIFLPSMAAIVTAAGWRTMSLMLAAAVLALTPVLVLWMRDRPEDLGLSPYGDNRAPRLVVAPADNPIAVMFRTLATGVRSRDFWLIASGYFVCGATTNGLIGTHLIPACVDHGLSEVDGASLLAIAGTFALLGGMASGWLSDRCDNRILLACYYGFRGIALLFLPFAFGLSFFGLSLFSVLFGLDWLASAPPTVRLLTRVVGPERIGVMVAWIFAIHQIGSATAAYLGGLLRIAFGTYFNAFVVAGLLLFAAAAMMLCIGAGKRDHEPEIAPTARAPA
jgi:sugar phosphate permease